MRSGMRFLASVWLRPVPWDPRTAGRFAPVDTSQSRLPLVVINRSSRCTYLYAGSGRLFGPMYACVSRPAWTHTSSRPIDRSCLPDS